MTDFADWLALREPADADARSAELAARLDLTPPLVIHDLGSGTGSMVRWLAPRLPGPQHWVLHERDTALLDSPDLPPGITADVSPGDLTRADLSGASLITASALLDMFTRDEIEAVVDGCAGHPTLLTLSVIGQVAFEPADPLDATVADAFDAHQRRGGLLGPDAFEVAVTEFRKRGIAVETRDTPWRLGRGREALAAEWFAGWVGAAREQRPDLDLGSYEVRRLADLRAGRLEVTVGHRDLLTGQD